MARMVSLIIAKFYEHAFCNAVLCAFGSLFGKNQKDCYSRGLFVDVNRQTANMYKNVKKKIERGVAFPTCISVNSVFVFFHLLRVMSRCSKKVIWSKCMLIDSCYHLIVNAVSYFEVSFSYSSAYFNAVIWVVILMVSLLLLHTLMLFKKGL